MPEVPPTTAIDQDAGQSPCCDVNLILSSPPNIYECRECGRRYDRDADDDEPEAEADTCQATTAAGDPCDNPAGDDGYCHLSSHGPE